MHQTQTKRVLSLVLFLKSRNEICSLEFHSQVDDMYFSVDTYIIFFTLLKRNFVISRMHIVVHKSISYFLILERLKRQNHSNILFLMQRRANK